MSLELFLYLVSVLDNIGWLFGILFFVGIISLVLFGLVYMDCVDDYYGDKEDNFKDNTEKVVKKILVFMAIITPLSVFIPSKKTLYAIGLSHYAKQTQIPQKLMDLLNQKLDDALGGEKL